MKGLLGPAIFILTLLLLFSGVAIFIYKPAGVAVDCRGEIEGYGVPGIPLGTYESDCRAEVEVSSGEETVCTGDAQVQGSASIISCEGLSEHKGEEMNVEADFYNESEKYAEDEGKFRY